MARSQFVRVVGDMFALSETSPRVRSARATQVDFCVDRAAVQVALKRLCERWLPELEPSTAQAIRYTVVGEGKRLRAIMLLEAFRACGGAGDAHDLAAAVEVVHGYSLVHDDLPCMDNDDMRRGRPTVHKAFGVPIATVAGLTMVPLAARAAWHGALSLGLSSSIAAECVRDLMMASGAGGMIGGQLLDLHAERLQLSLEELEQVHRLKTGALIRAAVTLGARGARANSEQLAALTQYGDQIGLAFQIADDVLDVTSTSDRLGKTAGKDVALQKSTYPALLGIEGARERAASLVQQACQRLERARLLTPGLESLAYFTVERQS